MPAAFGSLLKTDVDWDYATAPEDGCNGRMMYLPRGKVLGGSSSINAMVYIRGAHADYDGWRDQGNPGWGYDDLLPYFKRSEDNERGESEYHGVGGPLSVCESRSRNPMARRVGRGRAARRASSRNEDFNGADPGRRRPLPGDAARRRALLDRRRLPAPGRGAAEPDRRDAARRCTACCSTARARSASPASATASRSRLRAEREVILCAGAYNSPQLLMLSGIGPAEHLALTRDRRRRRPARRRPEPPGPRQIGGIWTTEEPVSLILGAEPEQQAAFAERGRGPADLERRRGRRLLAVEHGPAGAPTSSSTARR